MKFALFYFPPCGKWYVHSHKLYETADAARDAARKFLVPGALFAILPIAAVDLDQIGELA